MELKLGNEVFQVNENFEFYNKIRREFANDAAITAEKFIKNYEKYGNLDLTLHKFIETYNTKIEETIEKSCKLLFQLEIFNVSATNFAKKYYDKYFSIDDAFSSLADKLEEICDFADDLELKQDIKKLGRTKWSGGGFGLGGAIAGAITSTALNAAYGTAYAISDSLQKHSNNSKVNKLKNDLYNDSQTVYALFWGLYNSCMGVFFGLRDELEEYSIIEPIYFDSESATQLNENALKYSDDEEQIKKLIIKSIFMSPYDWFLYEPLFLKYKNIDGLEEFAKYFGVYIPYNVYMSIELKQRLETISKSPQENHRQLCFKIDCYIKISKDYNYDVTKEINALSDRFVKLCNSLELVEDAINFIKNQFHDDLNLLEEIISTLESRKAFFLEQKLIKQQREQKKKQAEELNKINHLSAYSLDEVVKKVQAYKKHSFTYNCDVDQYICQTLVILRNECSKQYHASKIITELNKIKHKSFPHIDGFIAAFSIKKKVLNFEEQLNFSDFYIFSPMILDLINNARNGNSVAQQWLVELLLQQKELDKLRKHYLNGTSNEKRCAEDTIQKISQVISYLFDKPSKYSFDLFMRIKISYPYFENIDEYITSIEPFTKDNMCSVAIFEFGKLLYEKNKYVLGLDMLDKAAENGYMRAVEFLYKHYSNENPNSFQSLYYKAILPHSRWKKVIYNYNTNSEDTSYVKMIDLINNLIVGKIFDFTSLDQYSNFLHFIFCNFNDENIEYALGFRGNFGDRAHLKTFSICLGIPNAESPLLSYNCKTYNNSYALTFTDKHLYYSKNGDTYKISYNDSFVSLNKSIFGEVMYNVHVFRHIYEIVYFSNKKYSSGLQIDTLEKMAYCGNPLAICNLLSNPEYNVGDDKKDIWVKLKENWQSQGKHFAVCPNCHEERTKEDMFCPECGTKIY